jgi:ribose transport system permease protein
MMVFARGLAKTASGGMKVATAVAGPDGVMHYVEVPTLFLALDAQWAGGGIAVVTVVFLATAIVVGALCGFHRLGRYWLAIGGNEEAARLSGVPVVAAKIAAYTLCGICAAIAGICQAAEEQQGDPEAGTTYELTAIAMVVMGGTSLAGGRGGMGLTLLGVLTIGYLDKILSINAVPEASRLMLTGVIVVLAVLAQKSGRS